MLTRVWIMTLMFGLLSLLGAKGREARASCAGPPGELWVLYPLPDSKVPRNAAIFITTRRGRLHPRQFVLVNANTGHAVKMRAHWTPEVRMQRLIPHKPLLPNQRYEIRFRKRVISRFQSDDSMAKGGKPTLGPVTVIFSKPARRSTDSRNVAPIGWGPPIGTRSATAQIKENKEMLNTAPVVVGVHMLFKSSPRRRNSSRFGLRYTQKLSVAKFTACSGFPRSASPKRGKYALKLIPWAATGEQGNPVNLKGKIE